MMLDDAAQLAALCGCPTLARGVASCPFCGEAAARGGVVAHARDACASAQPFLSPTGVVVVPRRCKAHFFGEAGARLQPCMAWLQRLAGASEPPASLRDACIAAAARAAACMPIEPCATLATHSVDALLRSLQDAAADGSWQRDGLLLLRAHAQLGLPSAELAAYVRTGCAAACAGAPTLLGEVFTQALPAQMWSPLAASPDGFAPGMASPAQLATLAARVDACIDAAWTALRGALATAAPGLDRAQFAEALLDAAAAEGCPMAALYAPMAPCELLNSGRRPTLLDTRALPRVTHALDDSDDDTVEVEPAAAIGAPLHPLAGASLSLRDGGLLGRRGHAHAGTSLPVAILSSAAACTPMHVEDWLFASYNAHLHGAPKVWYVVPTAAADAFVAAVRDRGSLPPSRRPLAAALLATKRLRAELPPEVLRELGVRRVVQQPGDIVLTAPGATFHWTLATGFCVAESLNFLPRGGTVADDADDCTALAAHAEAAAAWMRQASACVCHAGCAVPRDLAAAVAHKEALETELCCIMLGHREAPAEMDAADGDSADGERGAKRRKDG